MTSSPPSSQLAPAVSIDDQTLVAIAKYCFRSGIRTLAGVASIVDKLYKNGVTTLTSLEQYLLQMSAKDENILAILKSAGLDRRVTNNDRALYRTWTEIWGMPLDVILFVAEKSAGTATPTAYINRVLADYKQKGITTLAQAQSQVAPTFINLSCRVPTLSQGSISTFT